MFSVMTVFIPPTCPKAKASEAEWSEEVPLLHGGREKYNMGYWSSSEVKRVPHSKVYVYVNLKHIHVYTHIKP